MHDLTHAYTLVMVVSIVVVALTLLPVAFLPNKPPPAGPAPDHRPRLRRPLLLEQHRRDPLDGGHRIGRLEVRVHRVIEPQHRKPVHQ